MTWSDWGWYVNGDLFSSKYLNVQKSICVDWE
jgi:hypothetical protein